MPISIITQLLFFINEKISNIVFYCLMRCMNVWYTFFLSRNTSNERKFQYFLLYFLNEVPRSCHTCVFLSCSLHSSNWRPWCKKPGESRFPKFWGIEQNRTKYDLFKQSRQYSKFRKLLAWPDIRNDTSHIFCKIHPEDLVRYFHVPDFPNELLRFWNEIFCLFLYLYSRLAFFLVQRIVLQINYYQSVGWSSLVGTYFLITDIYIYMRVKRYFESSEKKKHAIVRIDQTVETRRLIDQRCFNAIWHTIKNFELYEIGCLYHKKT